jgi:alpha-ketoglutarate-dependent taurine dioxygenase
LRELCPHTGAEIGVVEPERFEAVAELADRHGIVLMRGFPRDRASQLRASTAIGPLVGRERYAFGLRVLPELRTESNRPDPATGNVLQDAYSDRWHSDLSWARRPADYTLLYALDVDGGRAATGFANTRAAWPTVSRSLRAEAAGRSAFHHVAQSRAVRYGRVATTPDTPPGLTRRMVRSFRREVAAARAAARLGFAVPAAMPAGASTPGVSHPIVQRDAFGEYLFLGDHAWCVDGIAEREGLEQIDALNAAVTNDQFVYRHVWQPDDLIVFANAFMLHRRETGAGSGTRVLRRTIVWRERATQ